MLCYIRTQLYMYVRSQSLNGIKFSTFSGTFSADWLLLNTHTYTQRTFMFMHTCTYVFIKIKTVVAYLHLYLCSY